jgi:hypothetical protein
MDTELWLRMFMANSTWGHIPEYLAGFRIHDAGKGSSWLKEYAEEAQRTHAKYPQFLETPRAKVGLPVYKLTQILSGRHLMATLDTRRNRGRTLTEVFGDWKMAGTPAAGAALAAPVTA